MNRVDDSSRRMKVWSVIVEVRSSVVVALEHAWQGWTLEWLETWARMDTSVSLVYLFIGHLVFLCNWSWDNSEDIQCLKMS